MNRDAGLTVDRRDGALVLTIDRPQARNAVTWDTVGALGDALADAADDDDIGIAVITGAEGAFCSGGDIKDQERRNDWRIGDFVAPSRALVQAITGIWAFPKPLLAAVNGVAAGAGAGLALLCDIRIAERSARFGFSFAKVGLGPDFGVTWTLPRIVGHDHAAKLLFSGELVAADAALELGLVTDVVEDGTSLERSLALAASFSANAPLSLRLAKTSLRRAAEIGFRESVEGEMLGQHVARSTDDHAEGLAAFLERRTAAFRGR